MGQEHALPAGFEDLAPFVCEWGHFDTQAERYRQRQRLPMERLTAFHAQMAPRMAEIFAHLDQYPFEGALPAPEALLLRLGMAMSEVAQAVELYGRPTFALLPPEHTVQITGLSHA